MENNLNVIFIPNNSDNYCYYCYKDGLFEEGFFVDVSEADKAIEFATELGITPKYLLTTHKHWDHSSGNAQMMSQFPELKVLVGAKDASGKNKISLASKKSICTDPVSDGLTFETGGMTINCMHTPCHTKGHICYYVTVEGENNQIVRSKEETSGYSQVTGFSKAAFTGDTLFIGTTGKFFEGTAKQMHSNIERLTALPEDTMIFPGHEYTVKSLQFCKSMDQENQKLDQVLEESQELVSEGNLK